MKLKFVVALGLLAAWPAAGRAEHADIDLRLVREAPKDGEKAQARASASQEPPGEVNPRPLLKVRAGEPLVMQFILTNTYPHGDKKDVTVRYFVVRAKKAGQKQAPPLSEGVVTRGQFKMTFKPKCRVGARVRFAVKEPGVYLLRVETANTDSDHEHFSAIDLRVESEGGAKR